MNELIKVTTNNNQEQVVSARGLYQELEIKKRFSEWWLTNSKGFLEGVDYTPYLEVHPQNKQQLQNYAMILDMAKHLAIQTQSKKGFEVRKYFIEIEKNYKKKQVPLSIRQQAILALAANEETNVRVDLIETDLKEIKENSLITTEDKNSIDRIVKRKVYSYCKERGLETKAKSMLFQDIGRSIKEMFNIPHRGRIKLKDFEAAIEFISDWEPSAVTKAKIKQIND